MNYLMNEATGVIVEGTPLLMKRKNLRSATAAEVMAMNDKSDDQDADQDDHVAGGAIELAEDFDVNIDISTMSRPELIAVGAKVPGFKVGARTKVGDVRSILQERLDVFKDLALVDDDEEDVIA